VAQHLIDRTYRLTDEEAERIRELAGNYRINVSELVRYLLDFGLAAVDSGQLRIHTRPVRWEIDPGAR
jgi:hypothetical protein